MIMIKLFILIMITKISYKIIYFVTHMRKFDIIIFYEIFFIFT